MSFEKRFQERRDKFDRDFDRMQKFAQVWFIFVALLALSLLGGVVFTVYKILVHFGIF